MGKGGLRLGWILVVKIGVEWSLPTITGGVELSGSATRELVAMLDYAFAALDIYLYFQRRKNTDH